MQRAVLYDAQDLRIIQDDIPSITQDEVLIKNKVATTCGTDVKIYKRGYPLLKPPHNFGHEFSGVIEKVGSNVKNFKEGDRVAVHNTAPCNECYYCKKGVFSLCDNLVFNRGAYAEYVKVPKEILRQNMFLINDDVSHKSACLLEPFACAVYGIQNCPINPGDTVIVNGAGPIGLMLAKLAVLKGAKVIVSDMIDLRLQIAENLGVWKAVNITGIEDSAQYLSSLTNNNRGADIVIEATGIIPVWESSLKMVRKGGFVLLFGGTKAGSVLSVDATLLHYSQLTIKGVFHTTPDCIMAAMELINMGVISGDDFIQNEYNLQDIEKALLEHAAGKVVKNCLLFK